MYPLEQLNPDSNIVFSRLVLDLRYLGQNWNNILASQLNLGIAAILLLLLLLLFNNSSLFKNGFHLWKTTFSFLLLILKNKICSVCFFLIFIFVKFIIFVTIRN